MKIAAVPFTILLFAVSTEAQTLKRLGGIGALFTKVNDSIATANTMEHPEGLLVTKVLPGETAEALKIEQGDILLAINGNKTNHPWTVYNDKKIIKREGEETEWKVWRNKKEISLKGKIKPKPFEKSDEFDIVYDQFPFKDGLMRCIISKPKVTNKKPAILLIQGFPCSSIDLMPAWHPHKQIADEFTRMGYLVMRAEKPGVGDCENTPDCYGIDFFTEVAAFKAAYLKMKSLPDVDTTRLFIFGHSMGGMEAPFIAQEVNPKGVIVYGVTIKNWFEYLLDMIRYQNPNFGIDYVQCEKEMFTYDTLLYRLLIEKKMPSELIKQRPDYEMLLKRDFNYIKGNDFITRDVVFSQTLQQANFYEAWSKVECNVLSAYGEYDIQAVDNFSHKEIVNIVNKYNKDKATYIMFPKTEHGLTELQNEQQKWEMYIQPGYLVEIYESLGINKNALKQMDNWIKNLEQ